MTAELEVAPLSEPASELPSMVNVGVAGRSTSEATRSSRSRRELVLPGVEVYFVQRRKKHETEVIDRRQAGKPHVNRTNKHTLV